MPRFTSFALTIVAASSLASALGAQGQRPRAAQGATPASPGIDALMSEREKAETGLTKMTPAERAAFERWLSRYTSAAVAGATRAAPGAPVPEATPQAPESARTAPRQVPRIVGQRPPAVAVGAIVEVASVLSGGTYVVLSDATIWEVWSSDVTRSTLWTPGDRLRVRSQPAPPGELFDLRFENGRTASLVSVRYAGTTSAAVATNPGAERAEALRAYTIFREASYGGVAIRGGVDPYYDCWWLTPFRVTQGGNTFYGGYGDAYAGAYAGGYAGARAGRRSRGGHYDYGHTSIWYGGGALAGPRRGRRDFDEPRSQPTQNIGVRGNPWLAPLPTISASPFGGGGRPPAAPPSRSSGTRR